MSCNEKEINYNVWYLNELPDKLSNFIDIFKIENERCE